MTEQRGITFGELPETEPQKPAARLAETVAASAERSGRRRTVMDGGVLCPGYGQVVAFSMDRMLIDVTSFGSAEGQYVTGRGRARLELLGGPMPAPGSRLTVGREGSVSFSGIVVSVSVNGLGGAPMRFDVTLEEL